MIATISALPLGRAQIASASAIISGRELNAMKDRGSMVTINLPYLQKAHFSR
jgi:hypothetical protein